MFNILKNIYLKNLSDKPIVSQSDLIVINRFLSLDKVNLKYLKILVSYLFYLTPINYFYLLYLVIPKRNKVPYHKNITKIKIKENKQFNDIQLLLEWSDRELEYYKFILEKIL
jgi:hypothetical protein